MFKVGDKLKWYSPNDALYTVSVVDDKSFYVTWGDPIKGCVPYSHDQAKNFTLIEEPSTMKSFLNPTLLNNDAKWRKGKFPQLLIHTPTSNVILAFAPDSGIGVFPKVTSNWNLREPGNYIPYTGTVSIQNG